MNLINFLKLNKVKFKKKIIYNCLQIKFTFWIILKKKYNKCKSQSTKFLNILISI